MPEPSAGLAAKNAWQRMRHLLFPFRPWRWLAVYATQIARRDSTDPLIVEMRRIRPYYRGTRLLTAIGILFILAAFVLPLFVLFVDTGTFMLLLIVYAVTFVTASIVGMVIQSGMDAVLAIQYECNLTFRQALRTYRSMVRSRGNLAIGYMSIKLAIDLSLSTLALTFYLPALLVAMYLMVYVTNAVLDHAEMGSAPYVGLIVVAMLAFLGFVATLLLTLPATAFYGYYTEEAVRMLQETQA